MTGGSGAGDGRRLRCRPSPSRSSTNAHCVGAPVGAAAPPPPRAPLRSPPGAAPPARPPRGRAGPPPVEWPTEAARVRRHISHRRADRAGRPARPASHHRAQPGPLRGDPVAARAARRRPGGALRRGGTEDLRHRRARVVRLTAPAPAPASAYKRTLALLIDAL